MQYVFKSIHELRPDEVQQYLKLYNKTFGRDLSEKEFRYKFTRQMGPNSYFVFIVDDKAGIVGSLGVIEVDYAYRNEQLKFGLTVDAMIEPEYRRDLLAMRRQHEILFEELSRRGFGWIFTKPNNNSYLYLKTLLGFSDVEELHAYGLPLRLFRASSRMLGFLDYPWLFLLLLAGWLAHPLSAFKPVPVGELRPATSDESDVIHRKRNVEFLSSRYGMERYHAVALGDRFVIFSTTTYSLRSACFALETQRMGLRGWLSFIAYVIRNHPEADVVLRVTSDAQHVLPLMRIPKWFLPNKFRIVVKAIGDRVLPADVKFRMDLSDFEVV